jgi:hypothetical protein
MRRLVLLLALTLGLAPNSAAAEPSPTDIAIARKLFAEATADEEGERWADALAKLKRVVSIKETPGIRFHMALCQERLGALMESRASYERSARLAEKAAGAESKQIVTDAAAAMVRIDGRLPTVTVNVVGTTAAAVTVDGVPFDLARSGQPFRRDPGELRVEARAAGKKPFERRTVLVDRDSVVIDVVLEDEAAAPPVGAAQPNTPQGSTNEGAKRAPPTSERPRSVPASAWITGGAALASAGVGVYWFVHRISLQSDTDATCADPYVRCDRQARDSKASTYLVGAIAAGGTALVLGGITAYLVIRPDGGTSSAGLPLGHVTVGGSF